MIKITSLIICILLFSLTVILINAAVTYHMLTEMTERLDACEGYYGPE